MIGIHVVCFGPGIAMIRIGLEVGLGKTLITDVGVQIRSPCLELKVIAALELIAEFEGYVRLGNRRIPQRSSIEGL